MIFEHLKEGVLLDDEDFNTIYPESIEPALFTHFTPVDIARRAAQYLVDRPGTKVLDIGSGAGKFCMIGAVTTEGFFVGVEQRQQLHILAKSITRKHKLSQVKFIHANITEIDFQDYDAFYFFNSFYENILQFDSFDETVLVEKKLYEEYSNYVKEELDDMPIGTRLVTYFSAYDEVPDSYRMQLKNDREKLTMWEKVK